MRTMKPAHVDPNIALGEGEAVVWWREWCRCERRGRPACSGVCDRWELTVYRARRHFITVVKQIEWHASAWGTLREACEAGLPPPL